MVLLDEKCATFGPDAGEEAAAAVRAAAAAGETVTVTSGIAALSPAKAAYRLGISRAGVQRRIISGEIAAIRVGSRYLITTTEIERARAELIRATDTENPSPQPHDYAAVYERILFPFLQGSRDRFFDESEVTTTAADVDALKLLQRAGVVIPWGNGLSLSEPHKAMIQFAAMELLRPARTRWSSPEQCAPLIAQGNLIPGSGEAVLRHFEIAINPIGTLPETVWHGTGPVEFSSTERPGWTQWVPDGLTNSVPIAVAYADLYCVNDWRANEFADYTLRRIMPQEG